MIAKTLWDKIPPNKKRFIVPGFAVGAVVLGALLFGNSPQPQDKEEHDTIESVLTDASPRKVGLQTMAAKIEILEEGQANVSKKLDALTTKLDERAEENLTDDLQNQVTRLSEDMAHTRSDLDAMQKNFASKVKELNAAAKPPPREKQADDEVFEPPARPAEGIGGDVFAHPPKALQTPVDTVSKQSSKIREISQPRDERSKEKMGKTLSAIPAGSIIGGTLMTGMDAPTGQAARRDPFPSLLRIKADAILPNFNTADIRECFILMSGWGDLSSERAYLRGERISCISRKNVVFESPIKGYAVGEDGKNGVRGRLVSKQGQMIGRAMLAGFLEGAANVFNAAPVPTLSLAQSGGTMAYQKVLSADSLQSSAIKGAGSALERIAKFYVNLADELFPVVEISAGRKIDIILSGSLQLTANGTKDGPDWPSSLLGQETVTTLLKRPGEPKRAK